MTCLKCRYDWCWECGEEYTSSHADKCEVRVNWRRNPPLLVTLGLLLAPVLFPFVVVFVVLYYVEALRRDALHREERGEMTCIESRWKVYPTVILLGLVLTPLVFLLFFLIAGGLLVLESRGLLRNKELGVDKQRRNWLLSALCVGLLLSPVTALVTVAVIGALHVVGLLLLFKKGYIWMRRRCDETYGLPKSAPGYLH
jgi:ABC-type Fe3+ transport system permease subunit